LWLGWRGSFLWLGLGLLFTVLPIALWLVRDDPADEGLRPYGATGPVQTAAQAAAVQKAQRVSVADAILVPQFWLLLATFFVRGLSLLFLLYVWNVPSLHLWAAIFGLNYISTVPPTTTLTANIFGRYSVGELSGWIFFSHQVGAALGAAIAGWIYEWTGAYSIAFVSAALMGFLAAGLALAIREEPVGSRPMGSPAPAVS